MLKRRPGKSLPSAVAMIGFTATSAQIILMREFIIVFYGNELCLGVILANWLLWGAVGSSLFGRLADRLKRRTGVMAICEIFIAFLLPALIFSVRGARVILKAQPGELIGFLPIMTYSFVILAPLCATLGFLFALGSRMFPAAKGAISIGYTYILEGVGASIGGLLTSLLMIRYLNSFSVVMIISALNLLSAASLRTLLGKRKAVKVTLRGIIVLLLVVNIYLLIPGREGFINIIDPLKADNLHIRSLLVQWGMLGLKTSENSIYSNITVLGGEDNYSFFSNGLNMFTVPNLASAEQTAHFPMLEHPQPREVLLIGGGVGGSLREILKHPLQKVCYVELDPLVIELAQQWLPAEAIAPLSDPKVEVEHVDGRLFVKRTSRKYDVIILDLPEPFTAQLNRFYTQEFFQEASRILADGGVFSLGVISSTNYLSREHQMFLNCIYKTLEGVFPDIIIIPADDVVLFIACKAKGVLTYDQEVLSERLRARQIENLYVSEYQMPIWLEPWRLHSFSERIREPQEVPINTDFKPVSYYYDMVLWIAQFSTLQTKYNKLFLSLAHLNLWWFLLPAFVGSALLFLFGIWKQSVRRWYILLAVMVTGFAEIAFEVTVSLSFQIIYGYMYYKLGLILTAFMIGLIIGSIAMTHIMDRLKDDLRTFIFTQMAVCIYPLILLGTFWIFRSGRAYFLGANVVFPIMPAIAGFIGGFQFPLATKIYLKYKAYVGRVAGFTYGMDLMGACAGAFLVSAFLIPIIGIPNTCLAVALLSGIVFILLIQSYFRQPQKLC